MTSSVDVMTPTPPGRRALLHRHAGVVAQALGLREGCRVLLVGADEGLTADLRKVVGGGGRVDVVTQEQPPGVLATASGAAPAEVKAHGEGGVLPFGHDEFDAAVWVEPLSARTEAGAVAALKEAYRTLRTKGRIVLIQPTVPRNPVVRGLTWPWFALKGVRWTSRDLFGMLERASFWECAMLQRTGTDGLSLVQGEKFSLNDSPDDIWTESQIVRALRVVGGSTVDRHRGVGR